MKTNPLQQIEPVARRLCRWMPPQRGEVGVVAGMSIPHLPTGGSGEIRHAGSWPSPKSALQFQGDDIRAEVDEGIRSEFGDKSLDGVTSDGALIRQ